VTAPAAARLRTAEAPPRPAPVLARRWGRVGAGLALVAAAALLAVAVYGNLGERRPVLAAARAVAAGAVLEPGDLRVVRVAADRGLATIPAAERARVVGRRAAVGLVAGSLLSPAALADTPPLPAGSVLVGALVKPGQHPLGLRAGDAVVVYEAAPPPGAGNAAPPAGGVPAVIAAVAERPRPEGTAVSLAVPAAEAARLARAGAEGRLVLVQPVG
jgi:hypothetical protein